MSEPHHDLETIQRWMQSVITYPGGVAAGMETPGAREQINIPAADIEQVVTRSQKLDAVRRLEVYSAAYFARLLECMRGEFPVLAATIGEELFNQFVVGYLNASPSKSYTLGHLGADFADYLKQTSPREAGEISSWAAFIIELAELEWTFNEIFDGPGAEHDPKLTPEQLAEISPAQWPLAKLTVVPCLRLLRFSHPVSRYFGDKRKRSDTPIPDPEPSYVAISRRDYIVRRFELTQTQFELLTRIAAGDSIGDAITHAANFYSGDIDAFAADLRNWFGQWSAEQYFLRANLP